MNIIVKASFCGYPPWLYIKDGVNFAETIYFDISPILLYFIRCDSNVPSIENITDESRADRK